MMDSGVIHKTGHNKINENSSSPEGWQCPLLLAIKCVSKGPRPYVLKAQDVSRDPALPFVT